MCLPALENGRRLVWRLKSEQTAEGSGIIGIDQSTSKSDAYFIIIDATQWRCALTLAQHEGKKILPVSN